MRIDLRRPRPKFRGWWCTPIWSDSSKQAGVDHSVASLDATLTTSGPAHGADTAECRIVVACLGSGQGVVRVLSRSLPQDWSTS